MKNYYFLALLFIAINTFSQNTKKFPFYLYESMPFSSSMKKSASNYLSIERFGFNALELDSLSKNKKLILSYSAFIVQTVLSPYTHEEGHRSILTSNNIGSVSMQFYDKRGVATVSGVRDFELKKFRDENIQSYLRMHTAGLESDFLMRDKTNEIISFDEDELINVFGAELLRSTMIIGYHSTGVFPGQFKEIEESENELENDIVGHDIFGAVKNFYRPTDSFYRYTNYSHLQEIEKDYLKKTFYSSLLNLLMPSYINFKIKNTKLSIGTGYVMAPFGGLYQLSFWHKSKYKMALSFQLYANRNSIGKGINFLWKDIKLMKNLDLTVRTNIFQQPKDLLFDTKEKFFGFLAHTQINYKMNKFTTKPFSLFLGMTYKTKGFVFGETFLKEKAYFDFGTALYF